VCAPCDWLAGAEWTRGARSQPRIQPHEMKRVRDELQDPPAIDATTDEESHFESDEDDDNDSRTGGPRLTVFPASHTWERTPAMREMKRRHQDALDDLHDGDREAHIFGTTLKGRDIVLEENLFPYECDDGIEHWTLWSRRELPTREIKAFVTNWCKINAPWVSEWAFEENDHLSFRIPHVHVFFRRRRSHADDAPLHATDASTSSPTRKRPKRWDIPPSNFGKLSDTNGPAPDVT